MTNQLSFFNTIDLTGDPLVKATKQCTLQEERVMYIMYQFDKMTPFQVSDLYNKIYPPCPVTSIRRSMTCLTDKGLLIMLDEMKVERYGKPNHFWKVSEQKRTTL